MQPLKNMAIGVQVSRTVWSALLGIVTILLGLVGVDVDLVQFEPLADGGVTLMEVGSVLSFIAAWFFRVNPKATFKGK